MFEFLRSYKWLGKRSVPCHTRTLTEQDLQQHLVDNFSNSGVPDRRKAKEILDCVENYFISARRQGFNAVWYGWFTQLCMRSPAGRQTTKIRWHKPFGTMMREISRRKQRD